MKRNTMNEILSKFAQPFENWLVPDARWKKKLRYVPPMTTPVCHAIKTVSFPDDVEQVQWYFHSDEIDEEWQLLGHLKTGPWFYLSASCTCTGFYERGRVDVWLGDTLEDVVNYGMDKETRDKYHTKTIFNI